MTTLEADTRRGRRPRTQEERSATTREKVIQAAIECIVEEGLHKTTAARLAARSGVTWGAIAHQFGDKESVLFAVVERNAEMYQYSLDAALKTAGNTLQERVAAMIDVTWKYINEPHASAFMELVVHNRTSRNAKFARQQQDLSNRQMKLVWDKFFGQFGIPVAKLDTARNFVLATLLGLSVIRLISHGRPIFTNEVAALKQAVMQILVTRA